MATKEYEGTFKYLDDSGNTNVLYPKIITDETLTIEGKAADAAVVGKAVKETEEAIDKAAAELTTQVEAAQSTADQAQASADRAQATADQAVSDAERAQATADDALAKADVVVSGTRPSETPVLWFDFSAV